MRVGLIIDILLLLIFIVNIRYGYKQGFMRAAYQIVSLVLTVVIVFAFRAPMTEFLYSTSAGQKIVSTVTEKVDAAVEKTDYTENVNGFVEELGFPEFISGKIAESVESAEIAKTDMANSLSASVTDTVMMLLAVAILFISVRIGLAVVMALLDKICRLPVLNFMNKAAGVAVGVVNALVAVYVLCALVMFLVPAEKQTELEGTVSQTYITKQFYNNNYLLELLCLNK